MLGNHGSNLTGKVFQLGVLSLLQVLLVLSLSFGMSLDLPLHVCLVKIPTIDLLQFRQQRFVFCTNVLRQGEFFSLSDRL
ncbi:hypothetical protein NGUA06_00597 [Salmonella enterica]|nr:hypothetical protein NGUA06_00597 [Salmonella enterica]